MQQEAMHKALDELLGQLKTLESDVKELRAVRLQRLEALQQARAMFTGAACVDVSKTVPNASAQSSNAAVPDRVQMGASVAEVLSRIRGALDRSAKGPCEVFRGLCRNHDEMGEADLIRALQAFEPMIPEAACTSLWRSVGKGPNEKLSFMEFLDLCGPADASNVMSCPASSDERRLIVLLQRLKRSLQKNGVCSADHVSRQSLDVGMFLNLSAKRKFGLSRPEAVWLFCKLAKGKTFFRVPGSRGSFAFKYRGVGRGAMGRGYGSEGRAVFERSTITSSRSSGQLLPSKDP